MNDPGIHQLEDPFVAPDARHDLFIDLHQMGVPGKAGLKVHGGPVELTVFCPGAFRISHGLVDGLRVGAVLSARGIVAFINEVTGLGIDLVPVRGALSDRHKENRGSATRCVIHPFLELLAFLSDDLGVGDDVVGFQNLTLKRNYFGVRFEARQFLLRNPLSPSIQKAGPQPS